MSKEELIDWLDRPPSNNDLDIISNIINLQERIENAIEYMKPRFMNCIDNDKRYFADNDIQELYEILGEKE